MSQSPSEGRLQAGVAKLTQFGCSPRRDTFPGCNPKILLPLEPVLSLVDKRSVLSTEADVSRLGHVLHDVETTAGIS